jgi:hypothetical protein
MSRSLVAATARTRTGAMRAAERSMRDWYRRMAPGRAVPVIRAIDAKPASWPAPSRSGRSWTVTIETAHRRR